MKKKTINIILNIFGIIVLIILNYFAYTSGVFTGVLATVLSCAILFIAWIFSLFGGGNLYNM